MASYTVTDVLAGTAEDINEDLNGECFIAGAEGEPEVLIPNNIVLFPSDFPTAADANVGTRLAITNEQMAAFIVLNTHACINNTRSEDIAVRVAYIRFLAARQGIISPSFSTASHNVRYNHAHFHASTCAQIMARGDNDFRTTIAIVKGRLTSEVRKMILPKFTNLVCCVAYIFRVRGHHYMSDFQDRYVTLWSRCLYKPEDLPLDWQYVATDALHAIMPDVLDQFWIDSAENARCAGTLIKRLDSAPAGAAGVVALERGLNDVTMLFPAVVDKVPGAYTEFTSVLHKVKATRWGGSINARFYGTQRDRIDEAKIGVLASMVLGIYNNMAPESKLRDSMALKRLAEIAPATGGAIGIAAARAAKDERLNLIEYTSPSGTVGAGAE